LERKIVDERAFDRGKPVFLSERAIRLSDPNPFVAATRRRQDERDHHHDRN
jgi:hypothetical protein